MSRGVRALFAFIVVLLVVSLVVNYRLISKRVGGDVEKVPESQAPAVVPVAEEVSSVAKAENSGQGVSAVIPEEPILVRRTHLYSNCLDLFLTRSFTEDIGIEDVAISPAIDLDSVSCYGSYICLYADWQPGELYSVKVKKGSEEVVAVVTAPDRAARVAFRTSGKLFPLSNDFWNLGVSAENLKGNLQVRIKEAYPNQALRFLNNPTEETYSHTIAEKEYPLKKIKNQEERLCIDLEEAGVPRRTGLYSITLRDDKSGYLERTQALIVTDLGVIATCGLTELCVAVRSLKDNSPVANAQVELYSRKYQLIEAAFTDEDGFCRMPYNSLIDDEDYSSFIVVTKDDDATICSAGFWESHSFRDRAELYPERGICRPGEEMRIYATLRDMELRVKGGVPMEFRLFDSRDNLIEKKVVTGDAAGLYAVKWSISPKAPLGEYSVLATAPSNTSFSYGTTTFLVGEYIPDRVRVTLDSEADSENLLLKNSLRAAYYFGTPFANGFAREEISARYDAFQPKGFEAYSFGTQDRNLLFSLESEKQPLDAEGCFKSSVDVSELKERVSNPVVISTTSTCIPSGAGRSVSATKDLTWHFADYYVGGFHDDDAKEFAINVIGVTPEGQAVSLMDKTLRYELYRISWDYVLKEKSNGVQERVWEKSKKRVLDGALALQDGWLKMPESVGRGEFEFVVLDENSVVRLCMDLWHWGGESGARLKDPRCLTFELDKQQYRPGENAIVTFECGMEGEGIAVPGLSELSAPIRFGVKTGKNQVSIPIPENLNHGSFFVSIHALCRKNTASDPMHFEGMVELVVTQEKHRLQVQLDTPAEAKPGAEIPLTVKLTNAEGTPVAGEVLVWGVDEGILALTAYKTPNPYEDFFGTIPCTLSALDNYWTLYPVVNAGTEKIGGGAGAKYLSKEREKLQAPAIVFLGTFSSDENGVVSLKATLPNFSGEMRFMALAANDESTGSGESAVVVRNETSLEMSGPRCVAPGDEFSVVFQGFNHSLPQGSAHWEALVEGAELLGEAQGDFALDKGGNATVSLKLKSQGSEGRCVVRLKMVMGDCQAVSDVSIVVRNPYPAMDMLVVDEIPAGGEKEYQLDEFDSVDFGTTALALTGSLNWLSRYPYGCLEQVTATAFPLLAVQPLVDAGILPADYSKDASQKIQLAQLELSAHRKRRGMMSMWPSGDAWCEGTYFAYLFYLEAEKMGFPLDKKFKDQMEKNLIEVQNDTLAENASSRVYCAFVLSYINPAKAYLYAKLVADEQCDGFCKFLKAITVIRCGHSAEGMADLEKLLETDFLSKHGKLFGFDSEIRRKGMSLWVLADVAPEHPAVKALADSLVASRNPEGHWGCTQDNAWAALGLAKFCAKNASKGGFAVKVTSGGKTEEYSTACHFQGKKTIKVVNSSTGAIQAYLRTRKAVRPVASVANGVTIHREYQDASGKPITQVKRGDLVRVVLKVDFKSDEINQFVISDLIPGGLEIEDDELATRARAMSSKDQERVNFPVTYLEKRFDRFLAFGDASCHLGEYTYSYTVRAVSEGAFAIAPIVIESMYRVDLKALELPPAESFSVLSN